MAYKIKEGNYEKYGVQVLSDGVHFTFEAEKEDACRLLFYGKDGKVCGEVEVPSEYCRGAIRSICVSGIKHGGLRYNFSINGRVVTDPYANRIVGRERWNDPRREAQSYLVCGGYEESTFDWKGDENPEIPRHAMVMYKLHVRGFTMDAGIRGKSRGTFLAVMERIPYLKSLGVTTVELMPVYEFEEVVLPKPKIYPAHVMWEEREGDLIRKEPPEPTHRVNYWGYVPGNYFAAKASYAEGENASLELKRLIRALHESGMECVMEMFFERGACREMLIDALRYWAKEYHVDGFHLIGEGIPMEWVARDPWLRRTKIFYDGHDGMPRAFGKVPRLFLYNDEYLYPARRMLNHMNGSMEEFLCQQRKQNKATGFVNYIADNNGFTLSDAFSYADKHNQANGEGNLDGSSWNASCNYGAEGRTGKRHVNETRELLMRDAIAILMLGQGVPLLFEGDEMGNTQDGNNNAYCQDNRIGWVNWKRNERFGWLREFARRMIEFRREHPSISSDEPKAMQDYLRKGAPDLSYHGESAWVSGSQDSRQAVGLMYCGAYAKRDDGTEDDYVYVGYNFHVGLARLALPRLPERMSWRLVMDTYRGREPFLEREERVTEPQIALHGQSVVILIGK